MKEKLQKAKENIAMLLGAWVITGFFMCEWAKANHDEANLRFGFIVLLLGVIATILALIMYFSAKLIYKGLIWLKNGK